MALNQILTIAQIIISIALITVILFQQRGAGGSAITGGSEASYYTKRGFEKVIYIATIILGVLFLGTAFFSLFL